MKKIFIKSVLLSLLSMVCILMSVNSSVCANDSKDYLFHAEFDGKDDTSAWYKQSSNWGSNPVKIESISLENGCLSLTPGNFAWYGFMAKFDEPINVEGRSEIIWETRIKFNFGTKENIGTVYSLFDFNGSKSFGGNVIGTKEGKLLVGGDRTQSVAGKSIDFELKNNVWYVIRLNLNFVKYQYSGKITDEYGNTCDIPKTSFVYDTKYNTITNLVLPNHGSSGKYSLTDYIRLWDDGYSISSSTIENGAKNISTDTAFEISFNEDIKEGTASVLVSDSEKNAVPCLVMQNGKKINVEFTAGLKYSETYIITIPDSVTSVSGKNIVSTDIIFTTEAEPFQCGSIVISGTGVSVNVNNKSGLDREVSVLILAYDDNDNLIKAKNKSFIVEKNTSDVLTYGFSPEEIHDISYVKAHLWNGEILKSESK